MNSGDTKTEAMLNVLGNGGSGDQFRGCCNTKTQSYILDAIDRINNLDPGGGGSGFKKLTDADKNYTLDGEDFIAVWLLEPGRYALAEDASVGVLANLMIDESGDVPVDVAGDIFQASNYPIIIIDTVEDNSETTIVSNLGVLYETLDGQHYADSLQMLPMNDFEGTDGVTDGMKGLVPAPTTSDLGKFLSASGMWEAINAGSGVTVLTADDYNAPVENPNRVAIGWLEPGFYRTADNSVYVQENNYRNNKGTCLYYVSGGGVNDEKYVIKFQPEAFYSSGLSPITIFRASSQYADLVKINTIVANDEFVAFIGGSVTSPPTTSTAGEPGRILVDITNSKAYVCLGSPSLGLYTWKEISLL